MSIHTDINEAPTPLLYTVAGAAKRLSIGRSSVYELLATKQLESITIGRMRRIPADALDAFVITLRSRGARPEGTSVAHHLRHGDPGARRDIPGEELVSCGRSNSMPGSLQR